jgi:diguanylate cyclase (GGDEF)-like protein
MRSIARLEILLSEIERDAELMSLTNAHAVTYRQASVWRSVDRVLISRPLLRRLNRVVGSAGFERFRNVVLCGLPTYEAVVGLRLTDPQYRADHLDSIVRRVVTLAAARFSGEYDSLTVMPNRLQLERAVKELAKITAEFADTDEANLMPVVMMMDLDNFKQANDTGGHPYGDALLRITSWRLQEFAKSLVRRGIKNVTVGRWGGEEFILCGLFSNSQAAVGIANELAESMANPPMTRTTDIDRAAQFSGDLQPPYPEPVLPVTMSIGGTIMARAETADKLDSVVEAAIGRADTAMYRAKITGKNRAVFFEDIAARHGRVLEHRVDAGVVVIDIGQYVGIREGDVFNVFPDDFARRAAYTFDDGRTSRKLGLFPELAVATIRVCAPPDRELAFCKLLEINTGVTQISKKAHVRRTAQGTPDPREA